MIAHAVPLCLLQGWAFAETNPSVDCWQICNDSRMTTICCVSKKVSGPAVNYIYLSLYMYINIDSSNIYN